MEIRENEKSIFQANLFYLIIGIMLLIIGGIVQSRNILSGLIITEYIIILLPTLLYMKIKGYNIKDSVKLNKISLKQGLKIPIIVLLSYPIGVFLNYIVILIINSFTELQVPPVPIPETSKELWSSLFIIALSPGICEEFMFRGLILSSYERLGKRKAIIFSAILFGIFHFNIQNLVGPIFLGLIFGIMVYKTNSIYPAMIGHATNNAISMIIGYVLNNSIDKIDAMNLPENTVNIETGPYVIISILILGVIAFAMGSISFSLIRSLPEYREEGYPIDDFNFKENNSFYKYIPLLIVGVIYIFYNHKIFMM